MTPHEAFRLIGTPRFGGILVVSDHASGRVPEDIDLGIAPALLTQHVAIDIGVAEVGADGWVKRFIEKPQSMENNLVVVGCYYFKSAEQLLSAIQTQMERNVMLKNEFFLTDAITIMLEGAAKVRTEHISTWLDTGTIEATLDTNRILLEKLNPANASRPGVTLVEPAFIHPSAEVTNSVIGPFVSGGANCKIRNSRIEDSILEDGVQVSDSALKRSLIGKQASVAGNGSENPISLNIGDNSSIRL